MEVSRILAEIDSQIAKLQQARALLAGIEPAKRGPGRPKSLTSLAKSPTPGVKRVLSPEARKRIADAQRKRWAATRKAKAATK